MLLPWGSLASERRQTRKAGYHAVKWLPTCLRKPQPQQVAFHPLVGGNCPQEHMLGLSSRRCAEQPPPRPRPRDQEGGLPSPDTHHSPAMTTGLRCAQRSWGAQGTGQKHLPEASRVHCPAWLASTVGPSRWGWGWGMEADQEGRGSQLVLGKIAEQGAVFFRF